MKFARMSRLATLGTVLGSMLVLSPVSVVSANAKDGKASGQKASGQKEQTIVLKMDDFVLPPNAEGFKCQSYVNPFGRDIQITGWSFNSKSESAHHLLVVPEPGGQPTPVRDCEMDSFDILIGSQNYKETVDYPDGVGTPLKAADGLRLRIHWANRSDKEELVDNPTLKIKIASDPIEQSTALYMYMAMNINVPAGTQGSSISTSKAPHDMELIWMASHMHDHGVRLTATIGGKTVWVSNSADNPVTKVFKKPLFVPAGTEITVQCDYQAPPEFDLRFGTSLRTAEMCALKGAHTQPGVSVAQSANGVGFGGGRPPSFAPPAG